MNISQPEAECFCEGRCIGEAMRKGKEGFIRYLLVGGVWLKIALKRQPGSS